MTIWPQITVLALMLMAWVRCLYLHGKTMPDTKYNAATFSFGCVVVMVLLGNGGFWKPLGW